MIQAYCCCCSVERSMNKIKLKWRFVKPKLVIFCYELAEVVDELALMGSKRVSS